MKKLLLSLAFLMLISGVFVFSVSSLAQGTFQPSCSETLKYKPAAFTDLYIGKNNDGSEIGQDAAALYWAACKQKQNEARLVNYPKLRTRLLAIDKYTNQFMTIETQLAFSAGGGGTMFSHGRARFQPGIEEHMSRLIDLTTTKAGAAKSGSITARYNQAKQTLEARLKRVQTTPKPYTEGLTAAEIATKKKEWVDMAKDYAAQYTNIRKLIGAGVEITNTTILEFLATGIWAEEL